jgi:hypothetical protein
MTARRRGRAAPGFFAAAALASLSASPVPAAPLSRAELATLCAQAEGPSHCARLVEEVQLKRLPNLAVREGVNLKVSLYPAGNATFADTEALNGGRSYSLWDYLDPINAVLLFTTDGDTLTYTLLQRVNGRKYELPTEPKVSPDRQRLVTADICEKQCVNEIAVWRVTREGVRKELAWKPQDAWSDAGATWKDADTLSIEYTLPGASKTSVVERRLSDPGWTRVTAP